MLDRTVSSESELAALAIEVEALEAEEMDDVAAAAAIARGLADRAGLCGADDLEWRARLVEADMVGRFGDLIASTRILWQVNAWAVGYANAAMTNRVRGKLEVLQQRAEVHARDGDWNSAFYTYKAFHAVEKELVARQRESRRRSGWSCTRWPRYGTRPTPIAIRRRGTR